MHVLITTDTVGGVWTYTQELVTGLAGRGHHVTLVSFGKLPAPHQTTWLQTLAGVDYHPTEYRLEWMETSEWDIEESRRYLEMLVREVRPDVLHFSQYCYGDIDADLPRIVVAHSDVVSWWVAFHGKEPDNTPWIRRYRELVKNGLRGADLVVAPSRWMLDTVSRHYVNPREGVVIYNGRTPELFDPNHEKEDFVLSVGRIWDEGKNVQLLVHAENLGGIEVAAAGEFGVRKSEVSDCDHSLLELSPSPDGATTLTVHNQPKCGRQSSPEGAAQLRPGRKPRVVAPDRSSPGGTTDNSPALQCWDSRPNDRSPVGTTGFPKMPEIRIVGWEQEPGREKRALPACSENVQLLGAKSQAELRELYASAAIYAATSRYEPFGLSPLEAALSGCALVMNDIPVFHELWGDSALCFAHNDSESLFELIAELKHSPGLREQYGARAYLTARQKFTAARMVAECERAYQQILSSVARIA